MDHTMPSTKSVEVPTDNEQQSLLTDFIAEHKTSTKHNGNHEKRERRKRKARQKLDILEQCNFDGDQIHQILEKDDWSGHSSAASAFLSDLQLSTPRYRSSKSRCSGSSSVSSKSDIMRSGIWILHEQDRSDTPISYKRIASWVSSIRRMISDAISKEMITGSISRKIWKQRRPIALGTFLMFFGSFMLIYDESRVNSQYVALRNSAQYNIDPNPLSHDEATQRKELSSFNPEATTMSVLDRSKLARDQGATLEGENTQSTVYTTKLSKVAKGAIQNSTSLRDPSMGTEAAPDSVFTLPLQSKQDVDSGSKQETDGETLGGGDKSSKIVLTTAPQRATNVTQDVIRSIAKVGSLAWSTEEKNTTSINPSKKKIVMEAPKTLLSAPKPFITNILSSTITSQPLSTASSSTTATTKSVETTTQLDQAQLLPRPDNDNSMVNDLRAVLGPKSPVIMFDDTPFRSSLIGRGSSGLQQDPSQTWKRENLKGESTLPPIATSTEATILSVDGHSSTGSASSTTAETEQSPTRRRHRYSRKKYLSNLNIVTGKDLLKGPS